MRQLTYEQQSHQSPSQPIGTLEKQGLPPGSNGSGYVSGTIERFIDRSEVRDWRHAVAIGLVSRSRYGTWESFRKTSGTERTFPCGEGCAYASDGVHIIIQTPHGAWISRSAQVVVFRVQSPYGGVRKVKAQEYLKTKTMVTAARSLADEYAFAE